MNRLWKYTRLLLTLLFVSSTSSYALAPAMHDDVPVGTTGSVGGDDVFMDTEPDVRGAAALDRFGAYFSEAYKESLLRSLDSQRALYGSLRESIAVPRARLLSQFNPGDIETTVRTLEAIAERAAAEHGAPPGEVTAS